MLELLGHSSGRFKSQDALVRSLQAHYEDHGSQLYDLRKTEYSEILTFEAVDKRARELISDPAYPFDEDLSTVVVPGVSLSYVVETQTARRGRIMVARLAHFTQVPIGELLARPRIYKPLSFIEVMENVPPSHGSLAAAVRITRYEGPEGPVDILVVTNYGYKFSEAFPGVVGSSGYLPGYQRFIADRLGIR